MSDTYTITPEIEAFIEECKGKEFSKSYLIAVLHKIQAKYGFLPNNLMEEVAIRMEIPTSKVYGVATFYHMFTLVPEGKHIVNICLGTACYVKGAEQVLNSLKNSLKIDLNQTTEDGLFTLKATRCIGTCGLAPVVMVDEKVYSNVTPDDVPVIIAKYKNK
ncbi:MAG: NADH-quinone oxidoreductase subunit NuoE [Candidatus Auribacterota bacterium]|jgi:NADH:ubiquinone oxidoreductase subunit E|uniref:NADH-quinone oxidoreductase subunit NuoE n=1 Tax=Candidatus Auribacter fodinae TaxID=2093366 RepID=A0A3A4RB51_9BACT|nr:MAG: NADH-quinone oxidoreductase subunit NuoE [Candidatus Auribacter fodinae]